VPVRLGIIEDRQLSGDARLQRRQHRRMPGQRPARHRLAKDLADHQRY
jgi:hypothetical protein